MTRKVLVKVGGETLKALADRQRLACDLAAVRAQGIQVCVVHGAGPQITALAERLGLQSVFKGGRRVTDEPMLEAAAMAMAGDVGPKLPAAAGSCVVGRKRPPRKVAGEAELIDYGLVADVAAIDPRLVETLWQGGFVPVLSSVVADANGQLLNLNADSLVTALTDGLHFDDVVLVTGVPGVFGDLSDPSTHLAELTDADIPGLIERGAVKGGMIAKLEEVTSILKKGASAVWIVGYTDEAALSGALAGSPGLRTVVRRAQPMVA